MLYDTLCFCRSRLTLPVRLAVYNDTAPIAEAVGVATKRALYVPLIVASASPTEGGGVGTGLHINTARSRIGASLWLALLRRRSKRRPGVVSCSRTMPDTSS